VTLSRQSRGGPPVPVSDGTTRLYPQGCSDSNRLCVRSFVTA